MVQIIIFICLLRYVILPDYLLKYFKNMKNFRSAQNHLDFERSDVLILQ